MKVEKEEFYPCTLKNCRFYTHWTKAWNEKHAVMCFYQTKTMHKLDSHQITLWCLSCKHFERQNNLIIRS